MGDDAGDGHVEGLVDVDERRAVLEDGGDEFVVEKAGAEERKCERDE